jgi:hypothetical protein
MFFPTVVTIAACNGEGRCAAAMIAKIITGRAGRAADNHGFNKILEYAKSSNTSLTVFMVKGQLRALRQKRNERGKRID